MSKLSDIGVVYNLFGELPEDVISPIEGAANALAWLDEYSKPSAAMRSTSTPATASSTLPRLARISPATYPIVPHARTKPGFAACAPLMPLLPKGKRMSALVKSGHAPASADLLELFPDCCIETPLRKSRDGFGRINLRYNGKHITAAAHRVAYSLFVAPVLPGEAVTHACNNPACCNPRHLVPFSLLPHVAVEGRS